MEHQDKKLEIWREAIPRMNEEDLEFILDFPECFEPKVLRMVKKRYEKITKPENGEEEYEEVEETLKDAVLRILREMDCSYDFDEDGDILLDRFFFAHQFVEYKMQQLYEEDHPNERVN